MADSRKAVLDALGALPPFAWYFALAAARGVIEGVAQTVVDDPTPEAAAVVAIDAELERQQTLQGRRP